MKLHSKILMAVAGCALVGASAILAAVSQPNEAKATYSGSIRLELGNDAWQSTSIQIGLYVYGTGVGNNSFCPLITPLGGRYYTYSWSELSFEVTHVIPVRVKSGTTNWGSGIWNSDDLYGRTNDIAVSDGNTIYLGDNYTDSKWVNHSIYTFNTTAYIKSGDYQKWDETTTTAMSSDYRFDDIGNLYFRAEVSLSKCSFQPFWDDKWSGSGNVTIHSSLSSIFSTSGNNIDCATAGTYLITYYPWAYSVSITTKEAEAADYAAGFLSATSVCDPDGVTNNITSEIWTAQQGAYRGLSLDSVRNVLKNAVASVKGTTIQQCAARYDYIVRKYSYNDFMNRSPVALGANVVNNQATPISSNSMATVATVAVIGSIAAAGGLIFLRKRKIF